MAQDPISAQPKVISPCPRDAVGMLIFSSTSALACLAMGPAEQGQICVLISQSVLGPSHYLLPPTVSPPACFAPLLGVVEQALTGKALPCPSMKPSWLQVLQASGSCPPAWYPHNMFLIMKELKNNSPSSDLHVEYCQLP